MNLQNQILKFLFIPFSILLFVATSCKKDDIQTYSITGKAQKGPFVTGANVTINELNDDMEQTGKSFSSSIGADDGSFALNSVGLASNIALVTVSGYYFDEHLGLVQNGTLTLQALSDISGRSAVNVNVLTHVLKDRVELLCKGGATFENAYLQAKNEIISLFFDINGSNISSFDQLDITGTGNGDALLLAFSVMMLKRTSGLQDASYLGELLSKLRTNFRNSGTITDTELLAQIWDNVRFLNPTLIKNNLRNRYQELSIQTSLPDFQTYLNKYVEKYAPAIYSDFYYPPTAHIVDPYYEEGPDKVNILDKSITEVDCHDEYVIAAITPFNKTLKIRILPPTGMFFDLSGHHVIEMIQTGGWDIDLFSNEEFIISTQRENLLNAHRFSGIDLFGANQEYIEEIPITVEYYENGTSTPTFTKTITLTQ